MQVTVEQIRDALKKCMDPEIPLSVVDLGLIYGIDINERNDVKIKMTMTTRGCPLHDTLVRDVRNALKDLKGLGDVNVEIVWDPPWTPDRMSEEAKAKIYGSKNLRFNLDLDKAKPLKQGRLERHDDALALYNDANQGFMINDALAEFWNSCDGTKTLNELIDLFAAKLRLPRIDIEKEVVELVKQLIDANLLKT
ncbi:MAG: PqqD family peptide modification chaperone [Candidatus Nitrosocaldaceae archaeon]